MRTSLSDERRPDTALRRALGIAAALSAVLAAVAIGDQAGGRSLHDHAVALYRPHGKEVSDGTLYGLVYGVAGFNLLAWSVAFGVARRARRTALVLTGCGVLVAACLALAVLGAREYGDRVFPPLWGGLALLPPLAGAGGVFVLFLSRRDPRFARQRLPRSPRVRASSSSGSLSRRTPPGARR